jgi:O-antigen/teichoic acid export membrane protein
LATNYFSTQLAVPLIQIFSLYFLIINLQQVLSSIFIATQQVKWAQMIEFIRARSVLLCTAAAVFFTNIFTIKLFSWLWLVGLVFAIGVAVIGVQKLYPWLLEKPQPSRRHHLHRKTWISYGRRVMLGQSASTLYGQVNQQFVLLFLGPAAAGIWAYYLSFFIIA